jgi:predicted nucleic acid-binding protein
MSTLVDTNVLLDIATKDPVWAHWSLGQLDAAAMRGPIFVNDIIYAELSVRYSRIEDVNAFLEIAGLTQRPTPRAALFLAAKVFQDYRSAGGARTGVLPDFFIGAHAAVETLTLLTRDVRRYRRHFPTLALIAP